MGLNMDLIEALNAAGIEWRRGRDDTEIYINCPFCTDQRFRLGVNTITGRAHCFNDTCEWKGYGEYTFSKLQEALDTGEISAKQKERKKRRVSEKIELPEGFRLLQPPDEDNDHWNKVAWNYIRKRGITREQIRDKKLGFTVVRPTKEGVPDLAYRIIFPVYLNGVLVGLSGRDFTGKQDPAHKNSVGSKFLYNLPERKHSSVCLSEATISALAIERASKKLGIDSCGLLGHSLQDSQISLLHHYKRVYLWLDPDQAGIEGLVGKNGNGGTYQKLRSERKSVKVIIPKGLLNGDSYDERDPDELEIDEIVKRLDRAESMTDGLAEKLRTWLVFDE